MKILDKRLLALEKSIDSQESDLSHLSEEELEERLERIIFGLGYRRAEEQEIPEGELDWEKFLSQGPVREDITRRELDTRVRLGGFLPDENRKENFPCL
jgi:hypothetical protein